jgi:PAS domain S-box-containing protein
VLFYEPEARPGSGGITHEVGELHRLLVESVQDYAIFALDPQGYILSWNAGAQRFKGYTAKEIIGKHFSIFYPQEKIDERFPWMELEVAAKVGRFEDEGWRIRKDGSRFWANVVITALRDEKGTLLGYAKVTRDLTERRLAEESLRESEERFRLMVENVRDYAIFMLDTTGHVATWNEGARRINGYAEDEIIGKHFSVFYPEADKESNKPSRELEIATETGKYEEEGWRVRKDGTQFWANVLITAIRNKKGELRGFGKVTRDLTERRAAQDRAIEDARRVASEEAARRGAEERQRELASLAERLRTQARELEQANLAKAQFLASMSHELRTPLNAIGGYVDLLIMGVRGAINAEQKQDLERVRRSQQHLLGIITDILNFSRVEAGQLTYDIVCVPLREVAEHVTQMVTPQAASKGLAVDTLECPPDLQALADRSKVEQILLNLLSNAVKFTSTGGVKLRCRGEGHMTYLTVSDTGSGIASDQLDKIFEPFVQVGRSLTSAQEGTGLGLAISRDLARAMGGDVTVESSAGEGSRFTLSLPRDVRAPGPRQDR